MLSRNNVPDAGLQDGGAASQGLEVGSVRPSGSGPEQSFVDVSRFSGAAVNGDDRHPPPAAALKALEQLLRAQSRLRQQQHRRAPGRGERERRPGTARRVRPADQWQWDLDRAQTRRATGGPPFSEWKMHASNRLGTASPRELHQGHFRAARAPTAGESGVEGENG